MNPQQMSEGGWWQYLRSQIPNSITKELKQATETNYENCTKSLERIYFTN